MALVRGINVGGKHRLPMQLLRELLEAHGCSDVQTYIQSGNVVFRTEASRVKRLPGELHAAIQRKVGFSAPVIVISAKQLGGIAARNPFVRRGCDEGGLHVAFLADRPRARDIAALDPDRSAPDEFILKDQVIYLHLPNGVARTKLSNAYFDVTLNTVATVRNWRTVTLLADMARRV